MRLVSYQLRADPPAPARAGIVTEAWIYDAARLLGDAVALDMQELLDRDQFESLRRALERAGDPSLAAGLAFPFDQCRLAAPLPRPRSLRDFYAFEQHVATANRRRGREVPAAWYEIPVFYFGNPGTIIGPEAVLPFPRGTHQLDFELEIACVIGKSGRDIPAGRAEQYIAGYTIMNDWSARDLQRQEMSVGLGPAKGKDFATSLGPWLTTPDELADREQSGRHDLAMVARINGREVSRGNAGSIFWTFAQMIERASTNVMLQPGDVIGSGTVGTGCILELGEEVHRWLEPGDVVELEIERLGILRNIIGEPRSETD